MSPIFEVLKILDDQGVYYVINRTRADTIRVCATFVGERWEIEIFEDGHVEISRFYGTEAIDGGIELLRKQLREIRR